RCGVNPGLRAECQYGENLQSLALSLINTVNAPINKAAMFLAGITGSELTPCEGYIAKLQKRSAKNLMQFREDLRLLLITRGIVYWDDTVVSILTQRACLRFYGDEKIAYYTAHRHKDMSGIDEDNVLQLLTEDTKVMHDHNTLNYNAKYMFQNIECNQHLERDCQKNTDDTGHKWSEELKGYINTAIHDRNKAIKKGRRSFDRAYIEKFYRDIDRCLEKGWKENELIGKRYGSAFERALLRRIAKYMKNYFMWLTDFSIPVTNNLSERGLRGVKSHMKISGQFESEEAADNYALIRSYIETCRRNGINEIDALKRLSSGNPYTVEEIFKT
ncbi:MAG: transposase, partial [Candidatus Weimeria sp.]